MIQLFAALGVFVIGVCFIGAIALMAGTILKDGREE